MNKSTDATVFFDNLKMWKDECLLLREIAISCGLDETIKWGGPCYTFNGENVVGIASFKGYSGIWFFQGGLLNDNAKLLVNAQENKTKAMRQWRFYSIADIENAPIREYILESIENFKVGKKIKPDTKKELIIPELLDSELKKDENLLRQWQALSLSCKREYAGYIQEAKKEETKIRRIEKIKPLILEKKGLNDKYMNE